jgi:hypothetical protein
MRPNGRAGMGRRLEYLEERARRLPAGSSGEARAYISGLLARYAAARQAGFVPEELEAEARAVRAVLKHRLAETRGEGYR